MCGFRGFYYTQRNGGGGHEKDLLATIFTDPAGLPVFT
jgi:hypothetical protein